MSNRPKKNQNRNGNSVVELVIAVIILFGVIFGSVDSCNAIYLQQLITEATYQGALTGIQPDMNESEVRTRVLDVLETKGLESATVVVRGTDGSSFNSVTAGERFEVIVTLPKNSNMKTYVITSYFMDFEARSEAMRQ